MKYLRHYWSKSKSVIYVSEIHIPKDNELLCKIVECCIKYEIGCTIDINEIYYRIPLDKKVDKFLIGAEKIYESYLNQDKL